MIWRSSRYDCKFEKWGTTRSENDLKTEGEWGADTEVATNKESAKKLDWFIIDQGAGGDRGLCDQGVGDQGEGDQGEGWQGQGDQGEGDLGEGGREQSDQGDGDAGQEGDQREGKGSEGRRKHDQVVSS